MRLLRLTLIIVAALCAVDLVGHLVSAAPAYTITQKWQRCYPGNWCETGWYASPAVADLDKNGQPEVLWGGYTLMSVNGSTGLIEWNRPQGSSSRLWPGIVVADVDHNASPDVVTASGNGIITVYDAPNHILSGWPVNPTGTGNEIRSLAVADIDANNDLEIVICSTRSDDQWFVYEHTGVLRPG